MSIRFFCDACSSEIVGQPDRIRRRLGNVMVEVMVCFNRAWNGSHICRQCVKRVIEDGEDVAYDDGYTAYRDDTFRNNLWNIPTSSVHWSASVPRATTDQS